MPIETKAIQDGLAFFQEGNRVPAPKAGNYSVRPVAGGPFAKANGQDIIKDLNDQFKGCHFLWLSKTVEAGKPADEPKPEAPASETEAENAGGEPEGDKKSRKKK